MKPHALAAVILALACSNASAFCVVTNEGCRNADGILLEINGQYVSPRTGLAVMDIPPGARLAYPGRLREIRYCRVLAPGARCSTDTGRILVERGASYYDTATGRFAMTVPQSRVRAPSMRVVHSPTTPPAGAGTAARRVYISLPDDETAPPATPSPQPPAQSPTPRYGFNPQTGELLAPSRSGYYVGPDGRVYAPAGRSGNVLVPIGR